MRTRELPPDAAHMTEFAMEALAVTITCQRETWAELWPDAQALARKHWTEIASYPDIPLDVMEERYAALDALGKLCVMTVRADGRLIGYAWFIVDHHLHYAGSRQALQDVVYLDPAFRGQRLGATLLAAAEEELRALGCQVVHHHVKLTHPALGVVLEKQGYRQVETVYSKRLDTKEHA